jgi:dihydroorotase-like cyclic amidohydrolase
MSRVMSANPARYYGMFPKKGVIRTGSDADLMIFDQHEEWELSPEGLNYTSDFSIYEGRKAVGRPVMTIVRGVPVMERGAIIAPKGHGTYVRNGAPADI